jgi:D-lactate dehydrogenase (cytochrome)
MSSSASKVVELLVGGGVECSTEGAVREQYADDYSHHRSGLPDAVAWPRSEEDVVAIVVACGRFGVPVIAYGRGTSLEGHICAYQGGVVLSFERFNKLVEVRPHDLDVTVQPGMSFVALNAQLRKHKLVFPIDAGPAASLGGMASCSASGTRAVKYGTMKENVLCMRVVLASGEVINTASRARKSAAGYDLTHLFLGAEGTLGVVTQLTLRVYPRPTHTLTALVDFPSVELAGRAVQAVVEAGVPVTMLEFMDSLMVQAINRSTAAARAKSAKNTLPVLREGPTLYLELSSSVSMGVVREEAKVVKAICDELKGGEFALAETEKDRKTLWTARKTALFAAQKMRGDYDRDSVWTTDVCVPISRFTECLVETQADVQRTPEVPCPIVAHAGDGNFHVFIVFDPTNERERKTAEGINGRLVQRAIALGGTCTGEHGVGVGKIPYLTPELGAPAVQTMVKLKLALDPQSILNPGKVVIIPSKL